VIYTAQLVKVKLSLGLTNYHAMKT